MEFLRMTILDTNLQDGQINKSVFALSHMFDMSQLLLLKNKLILLEERSNLFFIVFI